jgi:hypothetical protein
MFGINKDKLIENLEKIRKDVCCYANQPCDCKFRINEEHHNPMSEKFSGCCELSQVIAILKNMDEDDFKNLCFQSGIIL